jgi:hypothetical protein
MLEAKINEDYALINSVEVARIESWGEVSQKSY